MAVTAAPSRNGVNEMSEFWLCRRHLALKCVLAVTLCLLCASTLADVERVNVVGLFKDRAVVEIDGDRTVLRVGQRDKRGVRLISADSERAVLEVNGQIRELSLGAATGRISAASVREVQIVRDTRGMFLTAGSINSQPMEFLVDTGASAVVLNSTHARRLGINFRYEGEAGPVNTASGVATAYRVVLDRVRVGEIELKSVEALVMEGDHPGIALLGMSFLNRLELQNEGSLLRLRQRF